jgi:REP element-mobilizing transposase RayT
MSVHTPVQSSGMYFITFTCYNWLHLFEITDSYQLVYQWFDIMTSKGHTVTGYVIMPNHIHLLLYYAGGKQRLNSIVGNGKRFMAYDLVEKLSEQRDFELLEKLSMAVKPKDRSRGKLHEIWEESFDIKQCRTENFILQKLNYMHFNPCAERWRLSQKTYDYIHSSSSFYELGIKRYPFLKDYRDFIWLLEEKEY